MKTNTMRGNQIDMAHMIAKNATKIALGGDRDGMAKMNARGDIVGQGGVVVMPREEVAREYHRNNPKAVKQIALRDVKQEVMTFDTPAQAIAKQKELAAAQMAQKKRKLADSD